MDLREYETLFSLEEKYWWFVGQRCVVEKFLKSMGTSSHHRFLDVGCGTGINLVLLGKYGKAEGLDYADEAVEFCSQRGLKIVQGNAMSLPFADGTFDAVTALGVFYHKAITDDVLAMREAFRVLKPGGKFLQLDPAMMCLWGKHDEAFHGVRRYSRTELKRKFETAGFVVEKCRYINTALFPVVWLVRKLGRFSSKKPESDVQPVNSVVNLILTKWYCFEVWVAWYVPMPFGVNVFAVGRKPVDKKDKKQNFIHKI
ncbi:class I SAM-dependent methyltransferase [Candidatus Woesearchaeota archaeon]|nr:class I SAM-dependent methyltransferase [Candidatus Woesearchaeota archaeon]